MEPEAPRRSDRRRVGRESLVQAAATLFGDVSFEDVTAGIIGPARLAEVAGVSTGTASHHFPPNAQRARTLRFEALRAALEQAREGPGREVLDALVVTIDEQRPGDPAVVRTVASALQQELLARAPEDDPVDPTLEAEQVALLLAATVAQHDALAARIVRESRWSTRSTYEQINTHLLTATGRRWRDGLSSTSFAMATAALREGWVWFRRFGFEVATAELFGDTWIRLFESSTVAMDDRDEIGLYDSMLPPSTVPAADLKRRDAIVDAAARLYVRRGWEGLTMTAVADEAGVSRPTVSAHFGDSRGLAAAVWARHVPGLRVTALREASQPAHRSIPAHLERLVVIATEHRDLTASFLEGVFAYTVRHGAPDPSDVLDPRNLVPLPLLLLPTLEANRSSFRSGHAGDDHQRIESASLLTNTALQLAMTRPGLTPDVVASRVGDSLLAGMLRRRPSRAADPSP